jgi:hypothetical protein
VPDPNRVTPEGEIVAIDQRGLFMGNRGCLHRGTVRDIARPWQVRRWITCALEYKGWVAPRWDARRWTALFFWDEAVALAAGHRPCATCRHADYVRWLDAWEAAFGDRPRADPMDVVLHADRRAGREQRRHPAPWETVPAGAFVAALPGPALVLPDRLVPWSPAGYGAPLPRPVTGDAIVLTPRATAAVLAHGYSPVVHPSAGPPA